MSMRSSVRHNSRVSVSATGVRRSVRQGNGAFEEEEEEDDDTFSSPSRSLKSFSSSKISRKTNLEQGAYQPLVSSGPNDDDEVRDSQTITFAPHKNDRTSYRPQRTSLLGEAIAQEEIDESKLQNARAKCYFRCKLICCRVVDSTLMTVLVVVVTLFALVSSDLQYSFTNKPADKYFDIAMLVAMGIFTFEFVLSCFGREDYVCGFFFLLDIISTVSMALDLSYVYQYVCGGDTSISSARAGRTARLGARAARMVRVIRLFRLVKIYKAIIAKSAQSTQEQERKDPPTLNSEDTISQTMIWDRAGVSQYEYQTDDLERFESMSANRESRVGAKLSELTTRRVITVVMMLMLGLPAFQVGDSKKSPPSTQFGADSVWRSFQNTRNGRGTREEYGATLLNYMFYHNWFTSSRDCPKGVECSGKYYSHLFWVGIAGNDSNVVHQISELATLDPVWVDDFQKQFADQSDLYNYGTMPSEVLTMLGEKWNIQCNNDVWYRQGMSLLRDEIEGENDYAIVCPQDLRPHEYVEYHPLIITSDAYAHYHLVFYFDVRPFVRMDCLLSLGECAFVCLMFCFASMVLSHDVTTLVLVPIERMIQLMKLIRNDPRMAAKMAGTELKNELVDEKIDKELEKKGWGRIMRCLQNVVSCQVCEKKNKSAAMETVILEKTIMRLASLLTLGLGEAGLEIIGHSLSGSANAGSTAGIIDVLALPSSTVDCVIAVVRTQDFDTAIEVLQEKVVRFVSHIVEIVHGVIYEYSGAPNRNNGDNMLLIWRTFRDDSADSIARLAEMSLLSCAKIYAAVQKSQTLKDFSGHPGFVPRLGPDYHVSLTFGLHKGWAIEGAVGSEVKIDATYFSPHVNIAFAVENATSIYQVPILATGSVVELFSDPMYDKCRLIDRVDIKGSIKSINLYCLDLDRRSLNAMTPRAPPPVKWNVRTRFIVRQWMERQRNAALDDELPVVLLFQDDEDIESLRFPYTEAFVNYFSMAYQCYALGEWEAAASRLSQTLTMLDTIDGPSAALLEYMKVPYDFQAPKSWHGVRKLDDDLGKMRRSGNSFGSQGSKIV